ncbi:unnamed protein product [Heligmosomoides polygyrus]|uniref:HECW_N domain-containing protein n=1 Tax=Heligmosomoides polygyrus TaxID=6339 RepID=A0A183GFT4_HELPZ|nr:unnamed protein product [Heligmosomoides polygyrus]
MLEHYLHYLQTCMIVVRRNTAVSPLSTVPPICDLQLGVSTNLIYVGEETSQVILVSWKLSQETNMIDWIGLFNVDDDDPLHYLDHKGRGVVGPREGTVAWSITRAILLPTLHSVQFGSVQISVAYFFIDQVRLSVSLGMMTYMFHYTWY